MVPFIGIALAALVVGLAVTSILGKKDSKTLAMLFSGIALVSIVLAFAYSVANGSTVLSEPYSSYIPSLNISFSLTLNAVTFALALMASIVSFITIMAGNTEKDNVKTASILVLLFEFAALGLFSSSNLFIFFIFWDIGVIALFFMLYLLGSSNRRAAAIKFMIYELLASMLLLLAIMIIYFYTPVHSFDIQYIAAHSLSIPGNVQAIVFLFLAIAFLINMPVFPVHMWLPDAHTEASTQGSMLLSGILTKFGGYGMILAFLMVPISSQYSVPLAILAAFSAFYVSFVLMSQHDIKRVVAYTTIVEMSVILIGITAFNQFGTAGATYAMLAHGFTISMLFLAAGSTGHIFGERDLRLLRGVAKNAATTAYTFLVGVFSTTGVPLTAAFIGDILIFIGAFKSFSIYGVIPLVVLILLGGYLYYVVNKSFLSTKEVSKSVDYIERSQTIGYAALLFCILFFGIFPFLVLNFFNFNI